MISKKMVLLLSLCLAGSFVSLRAGPITDCGSEGGGNLNYSMLTERLVDELRVTMAPFIVGGEKAKTLVEGLGIGKVNEAIKLSLIQAVRVGRELKVRYKVMN